MLPPPPPPPLLPPHRHHNPQIPIPLPHPRIIRPPRPRRLPTQRTKPLHTNTQVSPPPHDRLLTPLILFRSLGPGAEFVDGGGGVGFRVVGEGIVGMGGRGVGGRGIGVKRGVGEGVYGGEGLRRVAFSAVATGGCGVVGGGVEEEF